MNVLLSSVGRRSYLVEYFKEALKGRGKVIATNSIAETTGMFAADVTEIVPPARDPKFVDTLLSICRKHKVRLLCSLHDWEAPYIALHKTRFLAEGIIPVVPDQDIVKICLDKYRTAQFVESAGVSSPKSFIAMDSVLEALHLKDLHFPLILKPRWGQGSISMKKVNDTNQLKSAYQLVHEDLIDSDLGYLADEEQEFQVLIQQFIQGEEFGVDIVNNLDGHFAACFVKHKFSMRNGETDSAETVRVPQIERDAQTLARLTKHPGNLDADFFMAGDGKIYLLEMNPRFGGGYPFSHLAGANIPKALIAWADGQEPDPTDLMVRTGVRGYKDIRMVSSKGNS